MYDNPKKFFIRMLLLSILTILNVVVLVILSGGSTTGQIIAVTLTVINAFLLLFMLMIAIINLYKYGVSKEKEHLGFHLLNFVFSLFVTGVFSLFYFTIIAGIMLLLLPFMA